MKLFIVLALAVAMASAASLNTISKFGLPDGRIINGQDAAKGEAPFMVSLQHLRQHFCGGSIISENWVLTAAHCLGVYKQIVAVAGINRLTNSLSAQTRRITKQIRHENYGGDVGPNDIGLCNFEVSFNLNALVSIIRLPLNAMQDTGDGRVYGFGYDNSGQLSNRLQVLNVTIIGFDDCNDYWSAPPLAKSNICIHNAGTTDCACSGDSGGGLVRFNGADTTIVGIVSWGRIPCGENSAPTVFTTVSYYLTWIRDKLNSNLIAAEES